MDLSHPADYRPGDEFHANSPWAVEPTPFQQARQSLDDARHLVLWAISYADEGKAGEALSEAEAAFDALKEAVDCLRNPRSHV